MSLSTRRPPGGLPSSVRVPRSSSSVRDREPSPRTRDDSHPPSSSDNRFRSRRSRSVPRKEADNPYRPGRVYGAPPVPSTPSRHSMQSSASSSSSGGSSAVSAASTAPSSLWDYVGWKGTQGSPANESEERVPSPEPAGHHTDNGNNLWSRVTAAAGGLSINVGKAWEAKDDIPEPNTPPGRDSRVTVALKKHYIKQVSDPQQLPAWLFSDIERQVGRSARRAGPSTYVNTNEPTYTASAPLSLRARHDDAYSQSQVAPTGEHTRTATHDEYKGPTRAATRLRAMRDARRGPTIDRETHAPAAAVPEPEPEPVVVAQPLRPRVGLPSRPTRPRRE